MQKLALSPDRAEPSKRLLSFSSVIESTDDAAPPVLGHRGPHLLRPQLARRWEPRSHDLCELHWPELLEQRRRIRVLLR